MPTSKKTEVTVNRRAAAERRAGEDRRQADTPVADERRKNPRRKVQRRRQIDPTTCERDYSDAEIEFMQAMDAYKRSSGRMFPTCSEILEVLRGLGYEKVTPADGPESDDNLADASTVDATPADAPTADAEPTTATPAPSVPALETDEPTTSTELPTQA